MARGGGLMAGSSAVAVAGVAAGAGGAGVTASGSVSGAGSGAGSMGVAGSGRAGGSAGITAVLGGASAAWLVGSAGSGVGVSPAVAGAVAAGSLAGMADMGSGFFAGSGSGAGGDTGSGAGTGVGSGSGGVSPLSLAISSAVRLALSQAGRLPVPITTSRTRLLKGGFRGSPRPSRSSSCTALLPRLKPLSHRGVWRSTRKLSPFTLMRSLHWASSPRRCCRGASSSSQSSSTGSPGCGPSGLTAISWALPGAGKAAGLRLTRCRRTCRLAPGAFTASPQGRAAYTVTRWLPGRSSGIAMAATASGLVRRIGGASSSCTTTWGPRPRGPASVRGQS